MKSSPLLLPAVLLVSTVCWLLAWALHAPLVLRAPVTLWFMAVCPGLAVVRHVRGLDPAQTWTLALALSLALDLLVATALLYLPPLPFTVALSVVTLIAALLPVRAGLPPRDLRPNA
ncbi:hypothetical protein DAETH_43160 (plasmid) [Deinococcus aetherius]|uniref:DUF1616 domain-containing protein n=1 Tax=Deinococcus aetherius TaxID=200252 RepID=A0ABM8AKJ5_9DEIO|nr:hypothetical protein [Deinococcus aetherius]BDP44347.1 hypothetical protein DAETH_43160 [Deinococcus aetherius]